VKNPSDRQIWKNLINRVDPATKKLWEPGTKSRVCSDHFELGFDYPILNLGYDASKKIQKLFPQRFSKRRKLDYNKEVQ